jgi:hypothetical protein
VTEQQAADLADTPGFTCRFEDGDCLVCVQFAHDVPSHPDTEALERRLRLALHALAPEAEITDVRSGLRFASEPNSPAIEALHRLRRAVRHVADVEGLDAVELVEQLAVFSREFATLDAWLCNGGSIPGEWARRHPDGDQRAAEQIAEWISTEGTSVGVVTMAS